MKDAYTSLVQNAIRGMKCPLYGSDVGYSLTKRLLFHLLLFGLGFFGTTKIVNAQCSNFSSQYPSSTQTISCGVVDQTISTCMYGGDYAVCTVNSGDTYSWNTCRLFL